MLMCIPKGIAFNLTSRPTYTLIQQLLSTNICIDIVIDTDIYIPEPILIQIPIHGMAGLWYCIR